MPKPAVIVALRGGRGGTTTGTLDELEQAWRAGGADALRSRGGPRAAVHWERRVAGQVVATPAPAAGGLAPVRVGGNIKVPAKVAHAAPVYPQEARDAGIQGVIILEATIDPAGVPAEVRVLRSIPPLDQAAIDAVRQWRYEPTLVNGSPVPVIMTVTVNFSLGPQ